MGNVSDRSCNEQNNTYFRLHGFFVIMEKYCTAGYGACAFHEG
jgi:hypothetical protein